MRLTFDRPHHLSKLHDELLAAGIEPTTVEGDGAALALTFDRDADEAAVQAVLDRHDPTPPEPQADPVEQMAERLAAVEGELRGMRERAAAATSVTGGAATVRDAIVGPNR